MKHKEITQIKTQEVAKRVTLSMLVLVPVFMLVNFYDVLFLGAPLEREGLITRLLTGLMLLALVLWVIFKRSVEQQVQRNYYHALFDQPLSPVFLLNDSGCVIEVNEKLLEMLNKERDTVIGLSMKELNFTDHDLVEKYTDRVMRGNSQHFEVNLRRQNGSVMELEVMASPVFMYKRIIGMIGIIRDRSKQNANVRKLERLANVDGLTGLSNRRAFNDAFDRYWTEGMERQSPLAVMMIDLDEFKNFNDTYGHLEGDECLKQIAGAIHRVCMRSGGMASRFGGEEFALLLPKTNNKEAQVIAHAISEEVSRLNIRHETSRVSPKVTVSIGVNVIVPALHRQREDMMLKADQALYNAKSNGKNMVKL
ncbi:PAS domain S-box-containing protein/diguanylate cyclase (GGDEF) domain-containing protein [Marinococcus luteus]|uniref:PAS domain S-box-containing protein/diguanylate cyclase (GGDEF) domain-containing protein n=1 Tax=Marinococcus luteus TaxID=1122204 RepID=A0A1H2U7V4_9BACI|nr:diguanylate cyclase [Marinococcus luteus]SDW52272.1 PAS domain S-box-containing protein/diguanylate cyclase (GGDEF) domain-containing protein [Marinococcus luteus]